MKVKLNDIVRTEKGTVRITAVCQEVGKEEKYMGKFLDGIHSGHMHRIYQDDILKVLTTNGGMQICGGGAFGRWPSQQLGDALK